MKASIIITNYNKSSYLEKCINSCLGQTYKNIEIILFDDCSNDSSNKIYNKFKKKIKIVENKKKNSLHFLKIRSMEYIEVMSFQKGM